MVRVPTNRIPTHPGEMLLEEFLTPMGISQKDLADNIEVPYQRINEIVNGRRGITPSTALRLAKFFDMSPDFWMNLQLRWDLYFARQDENKVLQRIQPYSHHIGLNKQASLKVKSVPPIDSSIRKVKNDPMLPLGVAWARLIYPAAVNAETYPTQE